MMMMMIYDDYDGWLLQWRLWGKSPLGDGGWGGEVGKDATLHLGGKRFSFCLILVTFLSIWIALIWINIQIFWGYVTLYPLFSNSVTIAQFSIWTPSHRSCLSITASALTQLFFTPNLVSCLAIHYIYHFNLTPSESMHNSAKGNNFLIECIVYGVTVYFLAVTKVSVLSTIRLKNAR